MRGRRASPSRLNVLPYSGHSGATNVTPTMDKMVSAKVEQWMNNNFSLGVNAWAKTAVR